MESNKNEKKSGLGKISLIAAVVYGATAYHDASKDAENNPSTPLSAFWGYRLITTAPDLFKGIQAGLKEAFSRSDVSPLHADKYEHEELLNEDALPWQHGHGEGARIEI